MELQKLTLKFVILISLICLGSQQTQAMGRALPPAASNPDLENSKPQHYPSRCSELAELAAAPQWQFATPLPHSSDFVLIDKSRHLLHLFASGRLIKSYAVSLGLKHKGMKVCAGDNNTPEGQYQISFKNPESDFHLSLGLDYPRQEDIDRAKKIGCDPGGEIMIHGLPKGKFKRAFAKAVRDWTKGCVAVKDREIEDIWDLVDVGTEVEICK